MYPRRLELARNRCLRAFSLAQAFTPGKEGRPASSLFSSAPFRGRRSSPILDRFPRSAFRRSPEADQTEEKSINASRSPGVNAWASEKVREGCDRPLLARSAPVQQPPHRSGLGERSSSRVCGRLPFGCIAVSLIVVLLQVALARAGDNWPQFRGPEGNGVSDSAGCRCTGARPRTSSGRRPFTAAAGLRRSSGAIRSG